MNIRIGSRLPVLTTAIGRIFLAYLPDPDVAALGAAERQTAQALGIELPSPDEMRDLTAEIRRRRLARIPSPLVSGIDALAAPVFDFTNKLVAVICVVARSEAKITGWNGSAVRALAETAAEVSARLGFADDETPLDQKNPTPTGVRKSSTAV
jgi:DNA-binding IclR family transcriptional regulator